MPIIRTSLGADGNRRLIPNGDILATGRYDAFYNLDIRAAKSIKLGGSMSANITLDVFNIFNTDTPSCSGERQINSGHVPATSWRSRTRGSPASACACSSSALPLQS